MRPRVSIVCDDVPGARHDLCARTQAGERGDIAGRGVETPEPQSVGCRLRCVERDQSRLPGRIECEFEPLEILGEARAQRLDRRFLVRPQREERVPPGVAVEACELLGLRSREMAVKTL